MKQLLDFLKAYWFLIVAFFTISAAYGQAVSKINTLEEAVKNSSQISREVSDIKGQVERTDERTKLMLESQAEQKRMVEMLLKNQQDILNNQLRYRK